MLPAPVVNQNEQDSSSLILFDSFTGTKQLFDPIDPDNVKIYI